MTLNGVMAVTLRYFTEFSKHAFQHLSVSICGGIYVRVYCRPILYCVYDVVVKIVQVRYLISWWVSCLLSFPRLKMALQIQLINLRSAVS